MNSSDPYRFRQSTRQSIALVGVCDRSVCNSAHMSDARKVSPARGLLRTFHLDSSTFHVRENVESTESTGKTWNQRDEFERSTSAVPARHVTACMGVSDGQH